MSKIQFYSVATPNGQKIGIALEEMGLEYESHLVDIRKNQQFSPEFLAINPNNKIPAIVDLQGPEQKPLNLFESGAILIYLAEKSGKFLPKSPEKHYLTIQWLMWQMAGFGPMLGQMGHFWKYCKEDIPYAKERYLTEGKRLFKVLNQQLEGKEYVIGDEYTIADMAIYPWVICVEKFYGLKDKFSDFPNISRWIKTISERPAVQKGMTILPFSP